MKAIQGGLVLGVALVLSFAAAPGARSQSLRIYHIDVDQADATLFISPGGQTLLVDSGKNGHGSRIHSVMSQAGVSRINHFVNTHYHEDHYGGIDDLVSAGVLIDFGYDRGDKAFLPPNKKTDATFVQYEQAIGHRATHLTRGMTVPLDPAMQVTVISSGGVVLGEEHPIPGVDENDMSVTLFIQYGGFQYFLGGDIEKHTEGKIADLDAVMDVDVYHADHHGSHTSSSSDFLRDLMPSMTIISNGNHGGHQHPRQVTLDSLAAVVPEGIVLQTNLYLKGGDGGNVAEAFIADLAPDGSEGTILIEISQSDSYTVSYRDTVFALPTKRGVPVERSLVIKSILPMPLGPDHLNEEVTISNVSEETIPLDGWFLQDRDGRVWSLASQTDLAPAETAIVKRDGMPMSLNDDGDDILLVNGGEIKDRFTYSKSHSGVRIETGH